MPVTDLMMSTEERTLVAMEAQLKLLRWVAGILVGFLLMATGGLTGFIVTELRAQANQDARLGILERLVADEARDKLNRQEYIDFSQRVLSDLGEIKAEQMRIRDELEKRPR
jgi:hypothetical protein